MVLIIFMINHTATLISISLSIITDFKVLIYFKDCTSISLKPL